MSCRRGDLWREASIRSCHAFAISAACATALLSHAYFFGTMRRTESGQPTMVHITALNGDADQSRSWSNSIST
ncbi:hypothetical protein BU26DRAFT_516571 [Trematosphaeria pertusa]|uniref:Uncharacterized protein n=1 Tax=Trematosphaeria pertusa TaxID=390896 RepID=A0A6A6IQH2_9PLEO|nr:uncharacterized protein BU26DRAFT_516571 [Trematosphaeria pertusa]KAF2251820.1 hypothetical protein BU26DRAFT_516571 [Trematosphaeria pertusa]